MYISQHPSGKVGGGGDIWATPSIQRSKMISSYDAGTKLSASRDHFF